MFPRLITRYGLAAHLALLASLPFVLFPFLSESALSEVIFWLSGLAFLWLLTEPSMRAGEHLSIARRRVLGSLVRDVAFWFFLCVLAVASIRYANSDVALAYVQDEWTIREPSSPGLPASAGSAGLLPLAVLTGMSVVVLGIRHGIGLTGRISFGMTASFIMGIGGLAMVVCACMQVPSFMGAAKAHLLEGPFWSPFWGPGFGAWLICALAFGAQAEARKWGASRVPFCLAVAGNASGLLFFSPPPVSTVFLIVAALVEVFCLAYLGRAGSMGACARNFVFMLLGFATPFFFMSALLPDEIEFDNCVRKVGNVTEKVKEPVQNIYAVKAGGFLAIGKELSEGYRALSPALSGIAKTVWKKHPWYGVGVGAFRLHVPFVATKEDMKLFQRHKDDWRTLLISQQMKESSKRAREAREKGKEPSSEFDWAAVRPYNRNPVCAFNSYWTFLAERGLLGVALAVLGLGVLLFSYVARLVQAVLYLRTQDDADVVIFACPPIVWATPFAVALLLVLALYEPVFEIAPMLLVCAVPLAVAAASFPKKPTPRQLAAQPLEGESR
jgi:hypothetical protein